MDRLKELNEAKAAAQEVIARIDNAISSLNSGSCHFRNGEVAARTAYDMEEILIVEV